MDVCRVKVVLSVKTSYEIFSAEYIEDAIGDVGSTMKTAGKFFIILPVEIANLSLKEPNKDLLASFLESLNLIGLFSPVD